MSFIVSIGLWIVKIITGPLVQGALKSLIADLAQQGKDYLPVVLEAVKTANDRMDLDSTGKFELALELAKAKFPYAPKSVLDTAIQVAYRMLKNAGSA